MPAGTCILIYRDATANYWRWTGRIQRREKLSDVPLILWSLKKECEGGGAEMCNYTYLIKYYDLCGRPAEASREEGQKTVFEMQRGRRAARRWDERRKDVEDERMRFFFFLAFTHAGCKHSLALSKGELGTIEGLSFSQVCRLWTMSISLYLFFSYSTRHISSKNECLWLFIDSVGRPDLCSQWADILRGSEGGKIVSHSRKNSATPGRNVPERF